MLLGIVKRLSFANVAMTLALVFAMTGGAYAAKKYLINSTKQINPKVITALKGKEGAPGSQGPAGPQGAQGAEGKQGAQGEAGKAGTNGTNGKDGANGKNVVVIGTASKCAEGGIAVEVEGSGVTHEVCNGKVGSQGPTGSPWVPNNTLPPGATETGAWSIAAVPGRFEVIPKVEVEWAFAPISFPIKLAKELGHGQVHVIGPGQNGAGGGCPTTSSLGKPEAEKGNLCVFQNSVELNVESIEVFDPASHETEEAATAGALIEIRPQTEKASIDAYGTWAVTAE